MFFRTFEEEGSQQTTMTTGAMSCALRFSAHPFFAVGRGGLLAMVIRRRGMASVAAISSIWLSTPRRRLRTKDGSRRGTGNGELCAETLPRGSLSPRPDSGRSEVSTSSVCRPHLFFKVIITYIKYW
jgi:hypothetical protein